MTNDVLRLKNDVLNELRNEKYYAQDELRVIVDNTSLSQKDKVMKVIDVTSKLVTIDAKIATVDAIFQTPAPAPSFNAGEPESRSEPQDDTAPTNVVEPALNPQGQTHSE